MNKVTLIGNLGQDPEVRFTQGGMAIATLSLATTTRKKDSEGNSVEKTEWHRVKVFGKTAEAAGKYLAKGRQIAVAGRIEYGSYEKDGVKHYTTDIICDELQMLGGRDAEGGSGNAGPAPAQARDSSSAAAGGRSGGYGNRQQSVPPDDPFGDDTPF